MATIEQRTNQDGKPVYRVKVRRKGTPSLTATFLRLTDAKKWVQITDPVPPGTGSFSGKVSMFGITQSATRAPFGQVIVGRRLIGM